MGKSQFPSPFNVKPIGIITNSTPSNTKIIDTTLATNTSFTSSFVDQDPEQVIDWIDNIDVRLKRLLHEQEIESKGLSQVSRVNELRQKYEKKIYEEQFDKLEGILRQNETQVEQELQYSSANNLKQENSEQDASEEEVNSQSQEDSDIIMIESEEEEEDEEEEEEEDEGDENDGEIIFDEDKVDDVELEDEQVAELDNSMSNAVRPQIPYRSAPKLSDTLFQSHSIQNGITIPDEGDFEADTWSSEHKLSDSEQEGQPDSNIEEEDIDQSELFGSHATAQNDNSQFFTSLNDVNDEEQGPQEDDDVREHSEEESQQDSYKESSSEEQAYGLSYQKSPHNFNIPEKQDDAIIILDTDEEEELEESNNKLSQHHLFSRDQIESRAVNENQAFSREEEEEEDNDDEEIEVEEIEIEEKVSDIEVDEESASEEDIEEEVDDVEEGELGEVEFIQQTTENAENSNLFNFSSYNPTTDMLENSHLLSLAEAVLKQADEENILKHTEPEDQSRKTFPKYLKHQDSFSHLNQGYLADEGTDYLSGEAASEREVTNGIQSMPSAPIPEPFYTTELESGSHNALEIEDNDENRSEASLADEETEHKTLKKQLEHKLKVGSKEPIDHFADAISVIPIFKTIKEESPEITLMKLKQTEEKFHLKLSSVTDLEMELGLKSSPINSRNVTIEPSKVEDETIYFEAHTTSENQISELIEIDDEYEDTVFYDVEDGEEKTINETEKEVYSNDNQESLIQASASPILVVENEDIDESKTPVESNTNVSLNDDQAQDYKSVDLLELESYAQSQEPECDFKGHDQMESNDKASQNETIVEVSRQIQHSEHMPVSLTESVSNIQVDPDVVETQNLEMLDDLKNLMMLQSTDFNYFRNDDNSPTSLETGIELNEKTCQVYNALDQEFNDVIDEVGSIEANPSIPDSVEIKIKGSDSQFTRSGSNNYEFALDREGSGSFENVANSNEKSDKLPTVASSDNVEEVYGVNDEILDVEYAKREEDDVDAQSGYLACELSDRDAQQDPAIKRSGDHVELEKHEVELPVITVPVLEQITEDSSTITDESVEEVIVPSPVAISGSNSPIQNVNEEVASSNPHDESRSSLLLGEVNNSQTLDNNDEVLHEDEPLILEEESFANQKSDTTIPGEDLYEEILPSEHRTEVHSETESELDQENIQLDGDNEELIGIEIELHSSPSSEILLETNLSDTFADSWEGIPSPIEVPSLREPEETSNEFVSSLNDTNIPAISHAEDSLTPENLALSVEPDLAESPREVEIIEENVSGSIQPEECEIISPNDSSEKSVSKKRPRADTKQETSSFKRLKSLASTINPMSWWRSSKYIPSENTEGELPVPELETNVDEHESETNDIIPKSEIGADTIPVPELELVNEDQEPNCESDSDIAVQTPIETDISSAVSEFRADEEEISLLSRSEAEQDVQIDLMSLEDDDEKPLSDDDEKPLSDDEQSKNADDIDAVEKNSSILHISTKEEEEETTKNSNEILSQNAESFESLDIQKSEGYETSDSEDVTPRPMEKILDDLLGLSSDLKKDNELGLKSTESTSESAIVIESDDSENENTENEANNEIDVQKNYVEVLESNPEVAQSNEDADVSQGVKKVVPEEEELEDSKGESEVDSDKEQTQENDLVGASDDEQSEEDADPQRQNKEISNQVTHEKEEDVEVDTIQHETTEEKESISNNYDEHSETKEDTDSNQEVNDKEMILDVDDVDLLVGNHSDASKENDLMDRENGDSHNNSDIEDSSQNLANVDTKVLSNAVSSDLPKSKKVLGLELSEVILEPRKSLRSGKRFGDISPVPELPSKKPRPKVPKLELPKQRELTAENLAALGGSSPLELSPSRKSSGSGKLGWKLDHSTDHPASRTRSKSPLKRSLQEIISSDFDEDIQTQKKSRHRKKSYDSHSSEEHKEDATRGRSRRR